MKIQSQLLLTVLLVHLFVASLARNTSFAIVTVFTLHKEWIVNNKLGEYGLLYGLKGMSTYSLIQGYSFLPVFIAPPEEELNWNRVRMTLNLMQQADDPSKLNCAYDWIVWMESDQYITNYNRRFEDIINEITVLSGKIPDVITNRDSHGHVNTGALFVRCSEMGRRAMLKTLELKITQKNHPWVAQWDSNGAIMLMVEDPEWKGVIALAPPKIFNAYAFPDPTECPDHLKCPHVKKIIACPDKATCDKVDK